MQMFSASIGAAWPTQRNEVEATVPTLPAFLCMKGILLVDRKKEKDAYDVHFCVANSPGQGGCLPR